MTDHRLATPHLNDPVFVRVLDVGGSHVNAAVVEVRGAAATIVRRAGRDIDASAERSELLYELSGAGIELGRDGETDRWGIAFPGPFDYETAIGSFDGVAKFGALRGLDLRVELSLRLGAQANQVFFLNDAVAYGLGEWSFGDSGRPRRMVCLTLGTGLGSAFLDDGVPVSDGAEVPAAGEAHRLTYEGRPIEDAVSTRAIVASFREVTGEHGTVREIAERARNGESAARAVLDTSMRVLGRTIGPWLGRFNATQLVIGGSISRAWDILEAPLRDGISGVDAGGADLELRPSTLLDDAPLLGAAAWVSRRADAYLSHTP